jgi:hypothetical protein
MTIDELRRIYPRVYRQVFDAGVRFERKRLQAVDLIANANPQQTSPTVFTPKSIQNALASKRERSAGSSWVAMP